MNIKIITPRKNPILDYDIAIVVSAFNEEMAESLLKGALERLQELSFPDHRITVFSVPGAIEIPLMLKRLAATQKFQAMVALGVVIQGQTKHFDYVCNQVSQGCLKISLKENIPVIFGVLTALNEIQVYDRLGGMHGHKGREVIDALVDQMDVLAQVKEEI